MSNTRNKIISINRAIYFLSIFNNDTEKLVCKYERIQLKISRQNLSKLFNDTWPIEIIYTQERERERKRQKTNLFCSRKLALMKALNRVFSVSNIYNCFYREKEEGWEFFLLQKVKLIRYKASEILVHKTVQSLNSWGPIEKLVFWKPLVDHITWRPVLK